MTFPQALTPRFFNLFFTRQHPQGALLKEKT